MDKTGKKILIVEDNKDFLWILKQSFNGQGFVIISAEDGEEGLKMIEAEKPDLVLLDILLPKMDGIEVAKAVKAKGLKTNIIFLTNLKDAEHISDAMGAVDATDYIIKSDLQLNQIITRVKEKLGIK